jgi:hypothetical protein
MTSPLMGSLPARQAVFRGGEFLSLPLGDLKVVHLALVGLLPGCVAPSL